MAEPTVQVPVSLIERLRDTYRTGDDWDAVGPMLDLLSQPAPSGEFAEDGTYSSADTIRRRQAALPLIEDMAPGTTFTAESGDGLRRFFTRSNTHAGGYYLTYAAEAAPVIDLSTIRDVTPPKGDSNG